MKIPLYKTEGIIIRRFDSNDFDKLLVVYTKDFGKILIKAKSLRKKAAKLKESLESFNYINLLLAHGKNIDTITGVVIVNSFPALKSHLLSVATAYYMLELIDKLVVAPEKDERIWQLILKAFIFLEQKQHSPTKIQELLSRFEHNLITYLGYQPIEKQKSYLDYIESLCQQPIESFQFLKSVL